VSCRRFNSSVLIGLNVESPAVSLISPWKIDTFFNRNTSICTFVHMSSGEILRCKECGQRFATEDAMRKHNGIGKEGGKKGLCKEIDWTSKARKTGKA
jgi:hypothetical protein